MQLLKLFLFAWDLGMGLSDAISDGVGFLSGHEVDRES